MIQIASSGSSLDGRAAIVFSSQPAEIGKIGGRPSASGTYEEAVKTPARQKGSYMGQPFELKVVWEKEQRSLRQMSLNFQ